MPHAREVTFLGDVVLPALEVASPAPGGPTEFDAAFARLDGLAGDGAALARGLLRTARGDFAEALALLDPLAARYPFLQLAVLGAERARAAADGWGKERQYRVADERQGDLPRVALDVRRADGGEGRVVLELFEDDVQNTVKNFVWLVEHGFYDGTTFHRTLPFFAVEGGDPFTREGGATVPSGAGGPGYGIPYEKGGARARLPFRGTLGMCGAGVGTEGSTFFVLTGTAAHLEGQYTLFGRVMEGQEAVDALRAGDRVVRATVLRKRDGVEYRPLTTEGAPAPEPTPARR
jgi:peptidyl-prolyl cis-trans isomerase B (cyclophilin B)